MKKVETVLKTQRASSGSQEEEGELLMIQGNTVEF